MQQDYNSQQSFAELAGEQRKEVVSAFNGGDLSSDGGLLLIAQVERQLDLCSSLADAMGDPRQQSKVRHSLTELIRCRVGGIAAGYSDCNDINSLRPDPVLRLFSGRPLQEGDLATQSTLSRLETGVTRKQVMRAAKALAKAVVKQLPSSAQEVIIEFDSTDDPCHGQQQFEGFNAYYGHHCFMPLLAHLVARDEHGCWRRWTMPVLLRPGRIHGTVGFKAVLKRIVPLLRRRFPSLHILVRADSGFGTNEVLCACEALHTPKSPLYYVVGLPQNSRLMKEAQGHLMRTCVRYSQEKQHWQLMTTCRRERVSAENASEDAIENAAAVEPRECAVFGEVCYKADSWPHQRRVLVKAAITHDMRGGAELNPRFVVTNLMAGDTGIGGDVKASVQRWDAQQVYRFYCRRGDQENAIKEWKLALDGGRTSCHRFVSNQFRLLLHGAAMLLLNVLQSRLPSKGSWAKATISTIRNHLLKVAARVTVSCRRIRIQLPTAYPHANLWRQLHASLTGPSPGVA
jgi:hypothetical protein